MRKAVLKEIHSGHQGIVKTKALACNFVRWPNLDSDVEQMCKECETCQMEQWRPQHVPLNPWEIEKTSFRLCRTFSEQHVLDCRGCLYEVVGSVSDVTTHLWHRWQSWGDCLPPMDCRSKLLQTTPPLSLLRSFRPLSSRMGFCTQQVPQDIQRQMVWLRDMSRLLKQVWKNLTTQPWTLMTDCPCSCCNIGRHQTVQQDSLQLISF